MRALSVSRRRFLTRLAGAGLLPSGALAAGGPVPRRVASLDYALTETLLALGVAPVAVANAGDWDEWVVEPPLPAGVVGIGSDREVNLELLAYLRPDLILTTPYVDRQAPALERIAPVLRLAIYDEGRAPLDRARAATRILGETLGRRAKAEAFLGAAEACLSACAARLAAVRPSPLLLVSFMDARHVRVYGAGGLYQDVLNRIGVENAWTGDTNTWGFATVGIERLATARNVRLVAVEPVPADAGPTLAGSPLWTELPFVRAGSVATLPPVLMFGAVPSALRFARLLVDHLEGGRA